MSRDRVPTEGPGGRAGAAGPGRPAPRKAYLLRVPADLLDAWRRIAARELRSLNAQIELELREALRRRGLRPGDDAPEEDAAAGGAREDAAD